MIALFWYYILFLFLEALFRTGIASPYEFRSTCKILWISLAYVVEQGSIDVRDAIYQSKTSDSKHVEGILNGNSSRLVGCKNVTL